MPSLLFNSESGKRANASAQAHPWKEMQQNRCDQHIKNLQIIFTPGNILDDASDNTFSADYRDDNTTNNATSFSPTI